MHRTRGLEEVTGPRSPAQVSQRGSAQANGPAASLPALQRQAGNAAVAALLAERMPGAGSGPAPMVQRVLSPSATYAPHGAALTALQELDAEVPRAERRAARKLRNPGGTHTPRQATYLLSPQPMTWGYCVEERLDPLARRLGWSTQHRLPGCRPDYYRDIGGVQVFADLTTAAQASPGGNHITTKLTIPHSRGVDATAWQASDLVHSGRMPGHAARPALQTNGTVTKAQSRALQTYRAALIGEEAAYGDAMDRLVRRYGRLSPATFTQVWDAAMRTRFALAVRRAVKADNAWS